MFAAHLTSSGNSDVISLPLRTIYDGEVSPATARAIYRIDSDGYVYEKIGSLPAAVIDQWCDPVTNTGNYEARATITSGSVNTGTFGSWLALSTSREWGQTLTSSIFITGQFLVEVRSIATGVVRATADIETEADRTL